MTKLIQLIESANKPVLHLIFSSSPIIDKLLKGRLLKFSRQSMNKDFISLFFVVFFVASGIFITNPVWVHAQTDVETTAFISVAPNPAEANQRINIIIRIEPPPPTPNDTFRNLTVTLTHPDESTNILGPYSTNPDGSREAFFYYLTPSYGNVTLKLNFPGQTFSNSTIYYLPSESQVTLTVNPLPSPVGSNVGSWETKKPMTPIFLPLLDREFH
jgi:hypothetical protein